MWSRGFSYFGAALEQYQVASDPKIFGNEIFVLTTSAAGPRLYVFDLDGNQIASIPIPGEPRLKPKEGSRGFLQPPAIGTLMATGSTGIVVLSHDSLFVTGWVAGSGPVANPLTVIRGQRTFAGAPVIGSGGEIVVRTWDQGFEVYTSWSDKPSSVCSLPDTFKLGGGAPLAFLNDQAHAHAYFSSAMGLILIAACTALNQAPMALPSAPVVTKSHVYATAADGLHSLSLGLPAASHSVAHVFMNVGKLQPAVGPQGTVYDINWLDADQNQVVVLRAFGTAPRDGT